MKRLISLCVIFLLFLTTACYSENKDADSVIFPLSLSSAEEDLLDTVLTNAQDIILLGFIVDSRCTSIDFWVEEYVNGVLLESSAVTLSIIFNNTDSKKTGSICTVFSRQDVATLSLVLKIEDEKVSSLGSLSIASPDKTAIGCIAENLFPSYNSMFTVGYILSGFSQLIIPNDLQQLDSTLDLYETALLLRCQFNSE